MGIVTVRRISQIFFLILMGWFCGVTVSGRSWWHLPGWPVNWLLELDPLVGLATLLATGTLYAGLIWGALTVVLTLLLGRFFCGWVCPLGTLQHFLAWLGCRGRNVAERVKIHRYHPAQALKYWLLAGLLAAATGEAFTRFIRLPGHDDPWIWGGLGVIWVGVAFLVLQRRTKNQSRTWLFITMAAMIWIGLVRWVAPGISIAGSLQTGLLDPLPLVYRSFNLILVSLADHIFSGSALNPRHYGGIGMMGIVFAGILLSGLIVPRLYCRFVCPLGALFGTLGRVYLFRLGKKTAGCGRCQLCETHCQGACEPASEIRTAECVLCFNCRTACPHNRMGYGTLPSAAGENPLPDLSRRSALISMAVGVGAISVERVQGSLAGNWYPGRIRPPGALVEKEFLQRCIKCGQCMRICPTNVLHPADLTQGWEAYWTPVLNFRIGRSGCQPNCVACSQICPTAALRPLSLAERMGRGEFSEAGPVALGTAFVDRGRCLPWAMDRPCIVCQENCPVSPKSIFTRRVAHPVRGLDRLTVAQGSEHNLTLEGVVLVPGTLASGDFACRLVNRVESRVWKIQANTQDEITVEGEPEEIFPQAGDQLQIVIHLQQPYVDPARCIGCGICEHECPVGGRAAIRVSAEGETRDPTHRLLA